MCYFRNVRPSAFHERQLLLQKCEAGKSNYHLLQPLQLARVK
jgi:hypothetical protein